MHPDSHWAPGKLPWSLSPSVYWFNGFFKTSALKHRRRMLLKSCWKVILGLKFRKKKGWVSFCTTSPFSVWWSALSRTERQSPVIVSRLAIWHIILANLNLIAKIWLHSKYKCALAMSSYPKPHDLTSAGEFKLKIYPRSKLRLVHSARTQ